MRYLSYLAFLILSCFAAAGYAQYFDYDPGDPAQQAPLREGEKAIIPLDTKDPTYNLWQTPRDDLSEGREPGPINIQRYHGGADWRAIDTASAEAFLVSQRQRQALLRELTARGEHLAEDGTLAGALLYPPARDALAAAARYRQVVVTQRYDFGKDVFPETPVTLRYFRTPETAYPHQDGRPYQPGEAITDRPVDTDPSSLTYGVGIAPTLIDENPEAPALRGYEPFLE